jgi:predicted nucleotidyltransferase
MSPELLNGIVNKIVEGYKPDKIILFGSYAYGTPTEDSDIDLFIVKDDNRKRVDRFCAVRKLSRDVSGVSVMPIVFTNEEFRKRLELEDDFILEIVAKGKVLYERK